MADIFLFGAGASMDAGLPDSVGLTDKVMARLAERGDNETLEVVSFVVGGLLFHEAINGRNPLEAKIDSEALFRSVELLGNRTEAELAAFVSSWHPRITELSQADRIRFKKASARLLVAITDVLYATQPSVDYLAPLAGLLRQQPQIVIATLNYDSVVEKFCRDRQLVVSTGIPESTGYNAQKGYEISFPSNGMLLLKLHGSLNWSFHYPRIATPQMFPHTFVLTWGEARPPFGSMADGGPAVLFGGQHKLTAEGPFLELFMKFRSSLREASRLIVVGYSFRDAHVNTEIASFVNLAPARKLVIIDPKPPDHLQFVKDLFVTCAGNLTMVLEPARNGLARVVNATGGDRS